MQSLFRLRSPVAFRYGAGMADTYRDTADRLHNDADFRCAVDLLWAMATKHGFTPGELRQIAFAAAIKCEEYATRSMLVTFPRRPLGDER